MAGAFWFDALAAIVVAAMVGMVGWRFAWHAMRELVDTGLDPAELEALRAQIASVGGVRAHHGLRTRRMGADVLVDVHVLVDPRISVSEGHRIADEVRERLIRGIDDVTEVLVHADHEPDTVEPAPASRPPLRPQILADPARLVRPGRSCGSGTPVASLPGRRRRRRAAAAARSRSG
jgi:divalent metal cation (Fe/Co/Zn/Cd) transporter